LSPLSSNLAQKIYIVARPGFEPRAESLSPGLNLPVVSPSQLNDLEGGLALIVDKLGLSVQLLGKNTPGPVRCDFIGGSAQHRRLYGGGKGQDIAKAVGLNHSGFKPQVLDLTAGLGRDGFVLASLGATVLMLERQPIVFALLEDGLVRARERLLAQTDNSDMGTKGLAEIMNRINTINQDANSYLKNLRADPSVDESCSDAVNPDVIYPDVIYIDPMFPAREKSGKVKKEMQLFHQLVGTDDDSSTLLPLALEVAQYRVVVKRSAHAPFLAEQKPGYSLKGKSTRFDIYPIKKLP
jgi:16S rRNA (guanine1516-N2)-methyltransferase